MKSRRWLSISVALGLAGGVACEDDLTEPGAHRLGDVAPEVRLDAAATAGVPSGALALENFKLIADTAGVSDVFQREAADGFYVTSQVRYRFESAIRFAGQDPRLPALAPLPDPVTVFAVLNTPERFNVVIWDFFMRWDGLELGQRYTYSVERLATRVNGVLDQLEFMLEGEVTQPDELVPLDPVPGTGNDYTWTSTTGCAAEPIPDPPPNPWHLGAFDASSTGRGTADFCMGSPWLWYSNIDSTVPDSSIVALNELRRGVTPHYNYVVVYEGEPPSLGPPVIRIQMGVDYDESGTPIPNAFAPFPIGADRTAALALPNVQASPSRIRFEIRDLEPLAATDYEAWLVNTATGASLPATADYFTIETVIVTDTLGQQSEVEVPSDTTRTSTFQGVSATNVRHAFIVRNSTLQPDSLGGFTHVVLARPGASGSAADPMFWAQYLDQSGTPGDPTDDIFIAADAFKLGAFDQADPDASRVFRVAGSGDGAIWKGELGMEFRRLTRPPIGYLYEVWLVEADGSATSVGSITTPAPEFESLDDADVQVDDRYMTQTQILEAGKHVVIPASVDLSQLVEIRLTLEPKAGVATSSPSLILSGRIPEGFY